MGIGGKRMDMEIEDKSSLPKGCINYSESDFAKNMNCPKSMIQWVDDLTNKIFSTYAGRKFKGNIGRRYCGRYYSINGGTDNVFVGLKFLKSNKKRVEIGFFIENFEKIIMSNGLQQLISANYECFIENDSYDKAYWVYVPFDYEILSCGAIDSAAKEIEKVFAAFLKNERKDNNMYLTKNNNHYEYFIGTLPDNKDTISIENSVIAREAFKNADSVKTLSLSKCKRIEEFAFENCKELTMLAWKDNDNSSNGTQNSQTSNKSIKGISITSVTGAVEVQHGAFKNCAKLQTVIFPSVSGQLTIEKEAFAGCGSLRTVVFYGSWKVGISDDAFVGCSNVVFLCSFGSPVERYAREHGFRIVNF